MKKRASTMDLAGFRRYVGYIMEAHQGALGLIRAERDALPVASSPSTDLNAFDTTAYNEYAGRIVAFTEFLQVVHSHTEDGEITQNTFDRTRKYCVDNAISMLNSWKQHTEAERSFMRTMSIIAEKLNFVS